MVGYSLFTVSCPMYYTDRSSKNRRAERERGIDKRDDEDNGGNDNVDRSKVTSCVRMESGQRQ